MKFYFQLQQTRIARGLRSIGLHPLLGIVLGVIGIIGISQLMYFKTEYANWLHVLFSIYILNQFNAKKRILFLQNLYDHKIFRRIRLIENGIVAFPIIILLMTMGDYYFALAIIPFIILFAMVSTPSINSKTLPTPFRSNPFEWIVGFRRYFLLIGISYFLLFKAVQVHNFGLGLFSLLLLYVTALLFYQSPEKPYFVWLYTSDIRGFFKQKIKTALIGMVIISLVSFLTLLSYFTDQYLVITGSYFLGILFLVTMILAKYSNYPHEMNLPQGILFAMSIGFPPLILFALWTFYKQSKNRLKSYLDDYH